MDFDLLVLGGGPGGYSAAFRAADLGLKVALVEKRARLGGVCLNEGCIPAKTLLHGTAIIEEADKAKEYGVQYNKPSIDINKLREKKESIIETLTTGLASMAKSRKVEVFYGEGVLTSPHEVDVLAKEGTKKLSFKNMIIATGSQPMVVPGFPKSDQIVNSAEMLALKEVPKRLLIVGGGIIGLEIAMIYTALGAEVTIIEMAAQVTPSADRDMAAPLQKRIKEVTAGRLFLNTKVKEIKLSEKELKVDIETPKGEEVLTSDKVLVAVGRVPNSSSLGKVDIAVDEKGFITVNDQFQTTIPHIYAIGDVIGQPMLAHKALYEGKIAAEIIAKERSTLSKPAIPSVVYTSPELAWVGLTEREARERGVDYEKTSVPWGANGRALSMGEVAGKTKLLFERGTGRLIGAAILGKSAGELIGEVVLALKMGSCAKELGSAIHAHPTLSETIALAAELYEGIATDMIPPKRG